MGAGPILSLFIIPEFLRSSSPANIRSRKLIPSCARRFWCDTFRLAHASMEQPCYKCGQLVEEGRMFCPNCGAPQIRVVLAESALAAVDNSITAGTTLTPAETVPLIAIPMRWSEAAQPCAVSAVISAVGIALKLINPLIAGIGAGFLAVALYRRRNPQIAVRARSGARIGAIAGFFCAGASGILGTYSCGHSARSWSNSRLIAGIRSSERPPIFRPEVPTDPGFHAF